MKIKITFLILAVSFINCNNSVTSLPPPWVVYPSPGSFVGTWSDLTSDSCIAVVTKDSNTLIATITNDSSKETLAITGYRLNLVEGGYANFVVNDSSSLFGKIDTVIYPGDGFHFSPDGNTVYYSTHRNYSAQNQYDIIRMVCNRK